MVTSPRESQQEGCHPFSDHEERFAEVRHLYSPPLLSVAPRLALPSHGAPTPSHARSRRF
jgi:hypothetical protein